MRSYFTKLGPITQVLVAIPVVLLSYPLVMAALPAIVHAVVPDAVRLVLRLM